MRFTFLNHTVDYKSGIDWQDKNQEKLWLYNLHYFDYLLCQEGLPEDAALRLIESWIKNNSFQRSVGFEPYPLSVRIVNWIKYFGMESIRVPLDFYRSLREQTAYLERNLEYHLGGNHLIKNAKALIFAGLLFRGDSVGRRWYVRGLNLLKNELKEQILPDGGHYERSLMYHSIILEDLLDVYNVLSASRPNSDIKWLTSTIEKMARFLVDTLHPDLEIPLFNDAAHRIAPSPPILLNYLKKLGFLVPKREFGMKALIHSGYYLFRDTNRFLMIDCGEMGPSYQPGHGHCDLLSFEFSLNANRIVVDTGCSTYIEGKTRDFIRGNAGHNTVTVDGENQAEIWASFRVAERAYPIKAILKQIPDGILFEGAHNGYRRLRGRPVHHRKIMLKYNSLSIIDTIYGEGNHSVVSHLHFHPNCQLRKLNEREWGIRINEIEIRVATNGAIEEDDGIYAPEFGVAIPNKILNQRASGPLPIRLKWNFLF